MGTPRDLISSRRIVAIVLACMMLTVGRANAETSSTTEPTESWQVIYIGGKRVGYAWSSERSVERDGRTVIVTDVLTQMTITRFNGRLTMRVKQQTEEDTEGNLLKFVFELANPPNSNTKTVGIVEGDQLQLTTTSGGRTQKSMQEWDNNVKSPAWQERVLRESPLEEGDTRSFKTFDPQFNRVAEIGLSHEGTKETELLDGKTRELEHIKVTHSLIPGFVIDSYTDKDGRTLKTETNLLGTASYEVPREVALEEIAGEELDLALETLVRVEAIERPFETERVRYRITVEGGVQKDDFPEGPTQQREVVSDDVVELTVTSIRPAAEEDSPSSSSPPGPDFLSSTRFLECKDPRIVELAAEGVEPGGTDAEVAMALEKFVHRKIRTKDFSTALATASEVARSLEGDCTEHAVLLAALLRVREIPSRVAVGLVYSPRHSGFAGHMWTEAYLDGRWVPLDATLGRGGIGATHIKMSDSSLADDAAVPVGAFVSVTMLLGRMRIEVESVEHR
ncbi:Transglutaminase-like superfamily protein [Maioricimonas rarisocia]|uniref:Transglutaminase-like superfamily protein n=1 Tax=Maioricimonas rarisocia TaxID=2528026 RepID=A0A517ZB90_9PLAN|nr:transglutaminase family protein [Maioricimonas rarisocia]QDU39764.1 Transglutaminase-like superfamily protein [Maioricimonas rarisocia]